MGCSFSHKTAPLGAVRENNSHNLHDREAVKQRDMGHNSPVITAMAGGALLLAMRVAREGGGTDGRRILPFFVAAHSLVAQEWSRTKRGGRPASLLHLHKDSAIAVRVAKNSYIIMTMSLNSQP